MSLVASNAALVAIFSHNSAAENAQKEAKGKGRDSYKTRNADNSRGELLGGADWQADFGKGHNCQSIAKDLQRNPLE